MVPPKTATPLSPAVQDKVAEKTTEVVPDNGGIFDTLNEPKAKMASDIPDKAPAYFGQVDYLRQHHDSVSAVDYLRRIVNNGALPPQERARAMIELADSLTEAHQEAEALCWLKLWMQMFPGRTEYGAVAYRAGLIYTQMGLPGLARDAFYSTLAHTLNEGDVQKPDDLKQYTRLTTGTLWALATNEYQAGNWKRSAELFDRYQKEGTGAPAASVEKAEFLEAESYYQLHDADQALPAYESALQKHPFNHLALEGRLRLYHLDMLKKQPLKAKEELEALAWTVRTVWPKEETYWQKQAAQLLLAINAKDVSVLPPVLKGSEQLSREGKSWQDALEHYDALMSYGTAAAKTGDSSANAGSHHQLPEEANLVAIDRVLNEVLPPARTASNP
jgi:outer membrane protein assembly factor BamD (BamD/ComL family)